MADGVNLYDLAAKISVDSSQSDKALTETQKKVLELAKKFQDTEKSVVSSNKKIGESSTALTQKLKAQEQVTSKAARALSGDLGGAITTVSPKLSALSAGPLTALMVGLTANLAAVTGLGVALFETSKSAAEYGSKIHDAAQESGATAETVSTLAYAAKLSGRSLDEITPGIRRFEVTIGEAARGSEKATQALKNLGIDPKKAINDLDGALAQAFRRIHDVGPGLVQVNLAADVFGRRSGPSMISTIETMNGDFVKFQAHAKDVGAVLSTDAANAADEFGDKLDELSERVRFLGIRFGLELVPQITEALDIVNRAITDTPRVTAAATGAIKALIETEVLGPLRVVDAVLRALERPHEIPLKIVASGPAGLLAYFLGQGAGRDSDWLQNAADDVGPGAGVLRKKSPQLPPLSGGGGGGKKRDPLADMKRLADLQLRIALEGIKREEDDIERSYEKRKTVVATFVRAMTSLENERNKLTLDSLRSEEDAIKKSPKIKGMERTIALQEIELKRTQEMNRHREEENKLSSEINQATRERIALTDTLVKLIERTRYASDVVKRDLGGGSVVFGGEATRPRRASDATRPRIATDLEEALRRQYQEHLERIRGLASDLRYSISNALYDGFREGAARGFASLAQGLLDILANVFFARLEQGLTDILMNIGSKSGGGGSWWQKLLGIGLGGLTGGGLISGVAGPVGGSGSIGGLGGVFAGSFASGGMIPMGQWGIVHDNERAVSTPFGTKVVPGPKGSGGQVVHNHYWNVVTRDAGSFTSRDTQSQIARQMTRLQQKVVLTG